MTWDKYKRLNKIYCMSPLHNCNQWPKESNMKSIDSLHG